MSLSRAEAIKEIEKSEGDSVQFEVFTLEEHATFLENYEKDQIEKSFDHNTRFADGEKPPIRKAFDKALFDVHSQYDDDLFKITGERKNSEEKTYDAIKRVVGVLKDKSDKLPGYIKEIADLKQGKVKDPDEQLKAENADLLSKHEAYKTETDKKITDMESGHQVTKIKGMLEQSMVGMKFKDSVPEPVRQSYISTTIANLIESADVVEGSIVFRDKEGIVIKNEANNLHPFTAKEMIQDKLKDIIDTGKKLNVKGEKPKIIEIEEGKKDILIVLPDSVETKPQLGKHLASLGLERNSPEYRAAWAKYSPPLKAR